jgi:hypothetical protein
VNYTRITAHFDTVENAKKAHRLLLKQQLYGHFTNIDAKNKKVSIENDSKGLRGLKKWQTQILMKDSRDNVLCWLDAYKGLSYTVLVSR